MERTLLVTVVSRFLIFEALHFMCASQDLMAVVLLKSSKNIIHKCFRTKLKKMWGKIHT